MKRISIGVFGLICAGKTSVIRGICSAENEKLDAQNKSEKAKKSGRMKPYLYKKETLSTIIQLLEVPSSFEYPLYLTDKAWFFDGTILILDMLSGTFKHILIALEGIKGSQVIVVINKIDGLFGKDPERIYTTCYNIMETCDVHSPGKMRFCISSAKYGISLFTGVLNDFSRDVFLTRLRTVYNVLNIADMHSKDIKKIFWEKGYFEVIDKTSEKYSKNKILSSTSDILVHSEGIPSLSHALVAEIQNISKRRENRTSTDIVSVESYCTHTNKMNFIVKKERIEEQPSIIHCGHHYKIKSILSNTKDANIHIIQIEEEKELLKALKKEKKQNIHTILLEVSGINENIQRKLEDISILYPGLYIKNSQLVHTKSDRYKKESSTRIYAIGPCTLEAFMQEVYLCVDADHIQVSPPLYNIKKTPVGHNCFYPIVEDICIKVEIVSNLTAEIEHADPSIEQSEKRKESEEPLLLAELEDDYNYLSIKAETIDGWSSKISKKLEETVKNIMLSIKTYSYALDIAHATVIASSCEPAHTRREEKRGSGSGRSELEIGFNRSTYRAIEAHVLIQMIVQDTINYVPKSSSDLLLNKLISKKSTKFLIKAITKKSKGQILFYAKDPFLSVVTLHISLPGSCYINFLSLISTFFKTFSSYILDTHYRPTEIDIYSSKTSTLPCEVYLAKKAKGE